MPSVLQITDKAPGGGGIRRIVEIHQNLLQGHGWSCRRLYLGNHPTNDPFHAPTKVAHTLPNTDPALIALRNAALDIDVIHLHLGFSSLSPDFITAAARLAPLVVNLHDISPFHDLPNASNDDHMTNPPTTLRHRLHRRILRGVRRALWRQICRSATSIVVPGHYLADRAVMAGAAPSKVEIIPHPIQPTHDVIPPPSRQKPIILYAGLLSKEKGPALLLEAFALLKTPLARLIFLGDGPLRHALETRTAQLGLSDRITFTGQVSPHDVARHMANMRVLAHPSLIAEGFGLVGIEAMQHERPVVGFGTGGAVDWLIHNQTGLVVTPKTALAFAAALDCVLTDDQLANHLAAGARAFVTRTFSPDQIGDQLSALLGRALSQNLETAK